MKKVQLVIVLTASFVLSSCNAYFNQPMAPTPARIGQDTRISSKFAELPAPEEPIVAAVYKFRDQTGQYKATDYGSSWSTAITQGATSILLKALEDSKWFVPIEREGLANLLNERKIINSSRMNYSQQTGSNEPSLPPLLFAGVILEGGIISYDYNILTGGAGARYLGIGANTQYREDRVSIYLRAISTNSGRILKSVNVSKRILSQEISAGVFKYVATNKLLEAESGFTYNEPTDIAVQEAIEKAVLDLIMEGVFDGLWKLKNPEDVEAPIFTEYLKEKDQRDDENFWGNKLQQRRNKLALNFSANAYSFQSDWGKTGLNGGGSFGLYYLPKKHASFLSLTAGIGKLKSGPYFETTMVNTELNYGINIFPQRSFSPYFTVGTGVAYTDKFYPYVKGGLGMEYLLRNDIGLFMEVNSNYLLNDNLDGINHGYYNDYFIGGKLGLNLYLDFNKKRK
ncbi:CsgG/HfaB family protein [Prolixibacter sp. NT017]|uniref:CsgG/HfaB family protein n=1 Tax=Prolixibacter sp. NT017 TaxID=2652390 RepID=UPI001289F141|nr:CsgG/HfaB family protein [Prolixibacter sp. NT017]GET25276.1 hypothetical protein NT017_16050 [Prolixibacter sp. NT017]